MSNIDHIILFGILFSLFAGVTKFNQKLINKHFWNITFILIITYSIVLGCRYGWGNDYLWYKYRIEHPNAYSNEEIGFKLINQTLKQLGLNYAGVYIIYSLVFIVAGFKYIKGYKFNKYMLALFLPATIILETSTIRQSLSISFIFLSLYFLQKKKYYHTICMLLIAFSIHNGNVIIAFIFILSYIITNYVTPLMLPWKFTIPFYIAFTISAELFNQFAFPIIENITSSISLDNKYQSYIETSDSWFSQEAYNAEYEQSDFTLILTSIFHISIIYLCYICINNKFIKNRNLIYIYNNIVIGILLLRLFFHFEILRRIAESIIQFYFIPLGYALYMFFHNKRLISKKHIKYCKICIYCIFMYLLLYFGRFILLSPSHKFIWNI